MQTIRRLYFYAVALISVEVVLWGLINLLRTTFSSGLVLPGAEMLAQALALILVGVPIFLLHWTWIQRAAAREDEEHTSTLRAVFLYVILLGTLIPVVQNTLALLNRLLITGTGLDRYYALLGGSQTWVDNSIAIFFNAIAAIYFFFVLRTDWLSLSEKENFAGIRRLYRYLWVLYSLLMTIFGVQQIIRFLFYQPTAVLGEPGREMFVNGISLVVIGAPIWAFMWQTCQKALDDPSERGSMLRMGVLYILGLAGVITVLSAAGVFINIILRRGLGETAAFAETFSQVGSPISVGVPLGFVWIYYGRWLFREIETVSDLPRRAGLKRFYNYILSFIGLNATFIGLALLFSFIIDVVTSPSTLWGYSLRNQLSSSISTLLAGLPLWLFTWRPVQAQSIQQDDTGDHARRSIVRRAYLYLVIFSTVIGGMVSAIWLFYTLLYAVLESPDAGFMADVLNGIQLLGLFIGFLAYHLACLRRDGGHLSVALSSRYEHFPVLIFEQAESGFADPIVEAINKTASGLSAAVQAVEQGIPEESGLAQAVILPSTLVVDPPEALRLWLKEYQGHKLVIAVESKSWYWPGGVSKNGARMAAQAVSRLAEGQDVKFSTGTSAWQVVAYVFAILFGLEVLFMLLMLGISLVVG